MTLRKPLDHDLLDDRVIKALKGQEERKERRALRKKQVRSWSHQGWGDASLTLLCSLSNSTVLLNVPFNKTVPVEITHSYTLHIT